MSEGTGMYLQFDHEPMPKKIKLRFEWFFGKKRRQRIRRREWLATQKRLRSWILEMEDDDSLPDYNTYNRPFVWRNFLPNQWTSPDMVAPDESESR